MTPSDTLLLAVADALLDSPLIKAIPTELCDRLRAARHAVAPEPQRIPRGAAMTEHAYGAAQSVAQAQRNPVPIQQGTAAPNAAHGAPAGKVVA